ncbi:protein SSUH2 homolog [Mixophyes fleayi]|uniref:protein SSUH2 homolog n=1 Tax=Mixophyes fleayi TaxID=3061075 RepID=UPI003F4E1F72
MQLPQELTICLGAPVCDTGATVMEQGANSDHSAQSGPRDRSPQTYRNVVITDQMAADAIQRYVSSRFCCSSSTGEELVIKELTQIPLYRYRLESFTETRHNEKTSKPYTGQRIDGPDRGDPPQLWDIVVQTPNMFHEGSKRLPLPHSAVVKECHKCQGRKRCKCTGCGGSGQFRCRCSSRQRSKNKRCHACSGSGRRRCSKCSGRGRKVCASCKGEGRLLHYQQLNVSWKTLQSEFLSKPPAQESTFPLSLLQKVSGEVILKDDDMMLHPPATSAESSETANAFETVFQDHRKSCGSSCHILRQRKTVEVIPVARVQYEYRGQILSSHVYGREHRVYAKRNPNVLFCGCSVM